MKNSNIIYGILFAVLGFFCILYPIVSTLWVEIMVGVGLIAGGIFTLAAFPKQREAFVKIFYVLLGILYIIGGIFVIANPILGAAALMTALGVIFILEGILIFFYLSKVRSAGGLFKTMSLINGIITLILGVLVLANPGAGIWFIGTLVGIDLLFTGISMAFRPNRENLA